MAGAAEPASGSTAAPADACSRAAVQGPQSRFRGPALRVSASARLGRIVPKDAAGAIRRNRSGRARRHASVSALRVAIRLRKINAACGIIHRNGELSRAAGRCGYMERRRSLLLFLPCEILLPPRAIAISNRSNGSLLARRRPLTLTSFPALRAILAHLGTILAFRECERETRDSEERNERQGLVSSFFLPREISRNDEG